MNERLITLSPMKVKIDITLISDGRIRLHKGLVSRYGIEVGDGIELMRFGVETVIRIVKQPDPEVYDGLLYKACKNGKVLQTRNICITRSIIPEGVGQCSFRCGDPIEFNGHTLIPIITRKNYYNGNKTDTT